MDKYQDGGTLSPEYIERLKTFENRPTNLHYHTDNKGIPTIGWGHKITATEARKKAVKVGDEWIPFERFSGKGGKVHAEKLLQHDIDHHFQRLEKQVGKENISEFNPQAVDVLFDIVYNRGSLGKSHDYIKKGDAAGLKSYLSEVASELKGGAKKRMQWRVDSLPEELYIPKENTEYAPYPILQDNTNIPPYISEGAIESNLPQLRQGGKVKKWMDILTLDVIEDDRGQWDHPGEITKINSPHITMKGVNQPLIGISDTGDTQMMFPGQDYHFEGKSVTEFPVAQNGITLSGPTIRGKQYPKGTIVTNDPELYKRNQDSLRLYKQGIENEKIANNSSGYKNTFWNHPDLGIYERGNGITPFLDWDGDITQARAALVYSGVRDDEFQDNASRRLLNAKNKPIKIAVGDGDSEGWYGLPVYAKPTSMVYIDSINRMSPKGLSDISNPSLIPNKRVMPDVIYKDNRQLNAGYNKGIDIQHRTDPLGRWAAYMYRSASPGVRGRISTTNPKGDYNMEYQDGGTIPIAQKGKVIDYDEERAAELGYTRAENGHLPSRDYITGRILKSPHHDTFNLAIEEDRKLGYIPVVDIFGNVYTINPEEEIPEKGLGSPLKKSNKKLETTSKSSNFTSPSVGWMDTFTPNFEER